MKNFTKPGLRIHNGKSRFIKLDFPIHDAKHYKSGLGNKYFGNDKATLKS